MSAIKVGINQNNFEGWTGSMPFNERFVGVPNNSWTEMTGAFGTDVGVFPAGQLDSDKWPATITAGHYVRREVYLDAGATYDVSWTGDFAGHVWGSDVTENSWDAVNRVGSITMSATPSQPFVAFKYTITDPVNYAKNIKVTLHGSSGRFTPKYITEINRYNGTLRFVKWVMSVEDNDGNSTAWGGGTYASPVYSITPSNRNTTTGGLWRDEYHGDGVPYEVIVECANAYTGDAIHINVPYVADNTYITNLATYLRDNITGGKTIYVEFSNEVWNGRYPCSTQANAEARDSTVLAGQTISSIVKGAPVSTSVTGTSHTTNIIDGITSTAGISNGMTVTGTGVTASPPTIVIATNTNQVTLSQPTTSSTTASFTFAGCPATVTTSAPHGLTSTQKITLSGASPSDYNVLTSYDVALTVNSSTTFTYMCATTPATNATVMGSYTTNLYPSFGIGGGDTICRYVHASKRCHDIFMSVFAGQTSRIKPMLCFQHGGSSATCSTVLNYANSQGWISNVKALATAPYWYSQTYGSTYTGSAATFLADCKTSMSPTMFTPAANYKAVANSYSWEYVSYEGDYGAGINDLTTQTNIKTDPTMYDTVLYFLQNMQLRGLQRLCAFNFCEPIAGGADGGYGHIFPSVAGVTVNKTNTPGLQAIVDYLAGTRLLYDCTLKNGTLNFHLNDADGIVGGTLDVYVVGATLSLNDPSGHFDIDQSGNIKVKTGNGGVLPAGTYTIGVVQTVPTGKGSDGVDTITTNVTATVASYALFSARYIRISASANSGDANPCVAVAEFEVATSAGGASVSGTATASGLFWQAGFETSKAIDADPSTYWVSNIDTTWPKVITLDFGTNSANWPRPAEVRIQDRTGSVGQGPGTFTVDISPDNATWTTIVSKSGVTWTAGEKKTYSV